MVAESDGDDISAGKTNKAQSGTELVVDGPYPRNDFIFQVMHASPMPDVGAIRGAAGSFGVEGKGSTGVRGLGDKVGLEGRGADTAIVGTGGRLGLFATGREIAVHAFSDNTDAKEGIGVYAVGPTVGVKGLCNADSNQGAGVEGHGFYGLYGEGREGGVAGSGSTYGVFGAIADGPYDPTASKAGVFGDGSTGVRANSAKGFALVATCHAHVPGWAGAGLFEGDVIITGDLVVSGAKHSAVPHPDGSHRLLHALESPEPWFEDFGDVQLANGRAEVKIDAAFGELIDLKHYHVYATPCGESLGIYVTNKSEKSFEIREQQGGPPILPYHTELSPKGRISAASD